MEIGCCERESGKRGDVLSAKVIVSYMTNWHTPTTISSSVAMRNTMFICNHVRRRVVSQISEHVNRIVGSMNEYVSG